MQCPKCPGTLEEKTYGRKISIHRCTDCGGLWCKPDVLLEMKKEWMSEAVLDSGDPKLGDALDKLDNIKCPEDGCEGELVKRKSRRGTFYGCSKYPQCTYITTELPEA